MSQGGTVSQEIVNITSRNNPAFADKKIISISFKENLTPRLLMCG
jgi:hypothetical protein